jgi:hypothetical protein
VTVRELRRILAGLADDLQVRIDLQGLEKNDGMFHEIAVVRLEWDAALEEGAKPQALIVPEVET